MPKKSQKNAKNKCLKKKAAEHSDVEHLDVEHKAEDSEEIHTEYLISRSVNLLKLHDEAFMRLYLALVPMGEFAFDSSFKPKSRFALEGLSNKNRILIALFDACKSQQEEKVEKEKFFDRLVDAEAILGKVREIIMSGELLKKKLGTRLSTLSNTKKHTISFQESLLYYTEDVPETMASPRYRSVDTVSAAYENPVIPSAARVDAGSAAAARATSGFVKRLEDEPKTEISR